MDEWLGVFTNVLELKKAYDDVKTNPSPEWEKFLKPAIYEFPENALIKDFVSDKRIRSVSADELNEMVKEFISKENAHET